MKVTAAELIMALEQLDPDTQIVMSQDEEGNGFSEYIEVGEEHGVAILWPGGMRDLEEVEDYEETEEDLE